MEKLTDRQTKTLHRLQELQGKFSFTVKHIEGKRNILADFASRNPPSINAISSENWVSKQRSDKHISDTITDIINNTSNSNMMKLYTGELFLIDNILYKSLNDKLLIVILEKEQTSIISSAHGPPLVGHQAPNKTISRIITNYWWHGIYSDTKKFIQSCDTCLRTRPPSWKHNSQLQPLEQCSNQIKEFIWTYLGLLSPTKVFVIS